MREADNDNNNYSSHDVMAMPLSGHSQIMLHSLIVSVHYRCSVGWHIRQLAPTKNTGRTDGGARYDEHNIMNVQKPRRKSCLYYSFPPPPSTYSLEVVVRSALSPCTCKNTAGSRNSSVSEKLCSMDDGLGPVKVL